MGNWALTRVSAPARLPVTLPELKSHLRIEDEQTDEDPLLLAYAEAAVQHLEGVDGWLGRALITQTWDLKLDRFPSGGVAIRPPLSPLQSVSSITYTDTNGDSQTWAASNYQVDTDTHPGRICAAYNVAYPATRDIQNAVTVRIVVGYGDYPSQVPEPIRLAIGQLVSQWYEHREPVITGTIVAKMPFHVESLLTNYRAQWF